MEYGMQVEMEGEEGEEWRIVESAERSSKLI